MSVEVAPAAHLHADPLVHHQYEDKKQQDETYLIGMWSFLVQEIMFFGGVFSAYAVYRYRFPETFIQVSKELNTTLGGLNTFVLLTSSFTMVLAVRCAQLRQRRGLIGWLLATTALAGVFLIVKYFEYGAKFEHHLFPGPFFHYAGSIPGMSEAATQQTAQLFFSLYFAATGLHALHVLIGMIVMLIIVFLAWRKHPSVEDFMPVEMTGLYWHFVDIVWIFLFPLLYLIPH